jgi:hypothetical protein
VEPDARAEIRNDNWDGLKVAIRELSQLRAQFEKTTQAEVRFNWFLRFDPQIEQTWGQGDWVREAAPDLIPWLRDNGDFTGIHLHFWRWDDRRTLWFSEFSDTAWQKHCLDVSVEGYRSVFGERPIASRFGDRSIGEALIPHLRKAGIRYDLTLEPGAAGEPSFDDPNATGWLADHRRAPRIPYHPSATDFFTPQSESNSNPLWMIPVTTTAPRWIPRRRFPFLIKTAEPMNLVIQPRTVWQHLASEIDRACAEPLVFVLRSGDLAQPHFLANFRYVTGLMAQHPGTRRCRFTSVDVAMQSYLNLTGGKGVDGLCLTA